MQKEISKKINSARIRLAVNELIEVVRYVLFFAVIVVLAGVIAERLLAIKVFSNAVLWGLLGVCLLATAVCWYMKIPSRQNVSLLIDRRLRLKERMISLMAFQGSKDVFAQATCVEARESISKIKVQGHFPINFSKNWFYSVGMWVMVGLLVAFLPQYDLLGYLQKQEDQAKQTQEIQLAEKKVDLAASTVKLAVKQLGDESLDSDLEKLMAMTSGQSPEALKRQAIQKLGDISDRIKKLEGGANKDALEITKKMLRQLRPTPESFSQKLSQALAKGDTSLARDMIKQFQKQLEQGNMTEEQKKQLSKQLANMAKQLERIAADNKALEDMLEKNGLDKKLAKLSAEDLKKMLEKQNLSPEQIEQLMQKMSACKSGSKSCSSLAKAMAACSSGSAGLGGDELSELAAQLTDMEAFEQNVKMMQASLDEIENAISCLGEGMCDGPGKMGQWKAGQSTKYGSGTGGPGRGFGARNKDTQGETASKATKVQNKGREGQVVASWYFKGEQVKGESSRQLGQVIDTAIDNAAEAISENEIPRRYEESVKNYFGGLEEQVNE